MYVAAILKGRALQLGWAQTGIMQFSSWFKTCLVLKAANNRIDYPMNDTVLETLNTAS